MSSVLAVVAKAVFEKQAPQNAQLGQVWATDAYLSHHAKLEPLGSGGALFLVTVRPPDERLLLVAVLESPAHGDDGWRAAPNVAPIADVTKLLSKLRFDSGKGNTAEPGKLGEVHSHKCILLDSGVVRCWGEGKSGQLGYGNVKTLGSSEADIANAKDVPVGGTVTQISVGEEHTCALLDTGRVRCWGEGKSGQLGYPGVDNVGDDETPESKGDVPLP